LIVKPFGKPAVQPGLGERFEPVLEHVADHQDPQKAEGEGSEHPLVIKGDGGGEQHGHPGPEGQDHVLQAAPFIAGFDRKPQGAGHVLFEDAQTKDERFVVPARLHQGGELHEFAVVDLGADQIDERLDVPRVAGIAPLLEKREKVLGAVFDEQADVFVGVMVDRRETPPAGPGRPRARATPGSVG
jgi:hypothetical protein